MPADHPKNLHGRRAHRLSLFPLSLDDVVKLIVNQPVAVSGSPDEYNEFRLPPAEISDDSESDRAVSMIAKRSRTEERTGFDTARV